jgi:hypothetical protein
VERRSGAQSNFATSGTWHFERDAPSSSLPRSPSHMCPRDIGTLIEALAVRVRGVTCGKEAGSQGGEEGLGKVGLGKGGGEGEGGVGQFFTGF